MELFCSNRIYDFLKFGVAGFSRMVMFLGVVKHLQNFTRRNSIIPQDSRGRSLSELYQNTPHSVYTYVPI